MAIDKEVEEVAAEVVKAVKEVAEVVAVELEAVAKVDLVNSQEEVKQDPTLPQEEMLMENSLTTEVVVKEVVDKDSEESPEKMLIQWIDKMVPEGHIKEMLKKVLAKQIGDKRKMLCTRRRMLRLLRLKRPRQPKT